MKPQEEYLNAKKLRECQHDNRIGLLYVRRVITGHAETQYGYVEHPAQYSVITWRGKKRYRHCKIAARKRCYIGRLSRYVTGRTCSICGRRLARNIDECYKCRQRRRIMQNTAAAVAGVR